MTFQASMFDYQGAVIAPKADTQTKELARVEGRLAEAILCWCALHEHSQFHMADLTEAITSHMQAAPDSVRRILAQLKRQGCVEVECIDRSKSLYRLGQVR
jgi:hypothetical protein